MTTYLSFEDVTQIHYSGIEAFGGAHGIADQNLVESAIAAPASGFGGQEFYETVPEKAAALAFSLVMNHGFRDGNKRVGFTAMAVFAEINGYGLTCSAEEGETVILSVADGSMDREALTEWAQTVLVPMEGPTTLTTAPPQPQ